MLYEERTFQPSQPAAIMVLGGSNCQLHALMRAEKEGYRVVLADYTDEPPGAHYAHVHLKVSTFDVPECIKAAREEGVQAVMTMPPCRSAAGSIRAFTALWMCGGGSRIPATISFPR